MQGQPTSFDTNGRPTGTGPIPTLGDFEDGDLEPAPDPAPDRGQVIDAPASGHDLVVVANRLPVDRREGPDGEYSWQPSPGGLVAALEPVMRRHQGVWIGWTGSAGPAPEPFDADGMRLVPIGLDAEEVERYYEGMSNGTLWPLYHDVIVAPTFHRTWWEAYVRVNRRFTDATAAVAASGARVWVQDYQLQLVPRMLRRARPDLRIGFFNHIPFPPYEIFAQLPWRRQVIKGLLGADLLGFQRPADANNFLRACRRNGIPSQSGVVRLDGPIQPGRGDVQTGRAVRAASFPVSIDAQTFDEIARRPDVQARAVQIRKELGDPELLLLGVDRLDYTKGILHRLQAYGELLDEGRLATPGAVLVQVATPSRERVEQYQQMRAQVEAIVGRINGTHGQLGSPAVHYLHQSQSPGGTGRPVPGRGRDAGDLVAGRDEPGREGVRGHPVRRGRGTDPERVHRCGDRAQAGLRDQPARHRRAQGGDRRGGVGPAAGDVPADAGPAPPGLRVRRDPLGHGVPGRPAAQPAGSGAGRRRSGGTAGRVRPRGERTGHRRGSVTGAREGQPGPIAVEGGLPPGLVAAVDSLAHRERLLVALDFDGVLAPIVLDPDSARPLPEASAAMDRLARTPGVTLALVSGRTLADLRRLAGPPPGAVLIGSHGAQFAGTDLLGDPTAGEGMLDAPASRMLALAAEQLQDISARHPGTFVELKPLGAVLHTRQASRPVAAQATEEALAGPAALPGVHLTLGKEVVDLAVVDATKGAALNRLRAGLGLPSGRGGVLYAGDDVTDERAFAVLDDARGDVTVKVGEGPTSARHRVGGPPEVAQLLGLLAGRRAAAGPVGGGGSGRPVTSDRVAGDSPDLGSDTPTPAG